MKTVYYSDDFIIFIVPGLIVKRSNSTNLFITGIETSLCAPPSTRYFSSAYTIRCYVQFCFCFYSTSFRCFSFVCIFVVAFFLLTICVLYCFNLVRFLLLFVIVAEDERDNHRGKSSTSLFALARNNFPLLNVI